MDRSSSRRPLPSLLGGDPRVGERWQAVYAFGWGFWLLLPTSTFDASKAWGYMAAHGPEWSWGLAAMLVSATAFAASFNGPGLRSVANVAMTLGWLFVAGVALVNLPPATVGVLLLLLGLRQSTLIWCAMMDWQARRWATSTRP